VSYLLQTYKMTVIRIMALTLALFCAVEHTRAEFSVAEEDYILRQLLQSIDAPKKRQQPLDSGDLFHYTISCLLHHALFYCFINCFTTSHTVLLHRILFYCITHCSTASYTVLLHRILLCCIARCFTALHTVLLIHTTLLASTESI